MRVSRNCITIYQIDYMETNKSSDIFIPCERLIKAYIELQKELLDELFLKLTQGNDHTEVNNILIECQTLLQELKDIYLQWTIKIMASINLKELTSELIHDYNIAVSPYIGQYLNLKAKVLTLF